MKLEGEAMGGPLSFLARETRMSDKRSERAQLYRKWYKTAKWKALRKACLLRDRYQCRIRMSGCRINASLADHIVPHRGDMRLFFDLTNLQASCKHCHDSHKKRAENRDYDGAVDSFGWPVDENHPANRRTFMDNGAGRNKTS